MDKGEAGSEGGDEDVLSNSSSFIEGRSSSVVISRSQLSSDRNSYKSAKSCSSCGMVFGKLLIGSSKKYVCKFCYTGVCQKCSPHKLMHPELKRKERCCGTCYSSFVADSLRAGIEVDLNRRTSEADVLMQKYVEERTAQEEEAHINLLLSEEVQALRNELARLRLEHESQIEKKKTTERLVRNDIQAFISEQEQLSKDLKSTEEDINSLKAARISLQQSIRADKAKLTEFQRLNNETEGDLKTVAEALKSEGGGVSVEEGGKSAKEAELMRAMEADREVLVKLQQVNIGLVKVRNEWKDRQKTEEVRQRSLSYRHSRKDREMTRLVEEFRSGSDQFDVPEIQRRVAQLQLESERLKAQISASQPDPESAGLTDLRSEIAKEKERNSQLMLSFQETLLSDSRDDRVADDRCRKEKEVEGVVLVAVFRKDSEQPVLAFSRYLPASPAYHTISIPLFRLIRSLYYGSILLLWFLCVMLTVWSTLTYFFIGFLIGGCISLALIATGILCIRLILEGCLSLFVIRDAVARVEQYRDAGEEFEDEEEEGELVEEEEESEEQSRESQESQA